MNLYIARHGESMGNTGEVDSVDPHLSRLGIRQSECLAERMKNVHLDAVISSPLVRAVETASKTAAAKNMEIEIFPLLFEVGTDAGYMGMGLAQLCEIYPRISMYDDGEDYPLSLNIENKEASYDRAIKVVERIRKRFGEDAHVMIFAHGTFNNFLINAAIGFDVRDNFNFCQENTGLTCIRFIKDNGKNKIKMEFSNDYCHLENL